jgi:hypothetical protein
MRPTRPHETHRSTTTKFRIDAYDAVVRLAREKRIAITDVMRRGAVLALEEYGAEIPASLSTYVRADAAPLTALDAVDRMMVAAPPALTSRQLTRLVIGLAGRTTLDVQAVRKIAAILLSWTSGFDCEQPVATQLWPSRRDDSSVEGNNDAYRPLRLVESYSDRASSDLATSTPPSMPRPVGSPPWGEP